MNAKLILGYIHSWAWHLFYGMWRGYRVLRGRAGLRRCVAPFREGPIVSALVTRAEALAYHAALRDWKEDFAHENGSYYCSCCICDQEFFGHKRRVVCKICASIPPDVHPK